MNKKLITGGALAGLILAGGIGGTLSAQTASELTGLSEEQAVAIALEVFPGEVQEIELEREKGMQIYEIEILAADGVENEIEINAENGEVLASNGDGDKDCERKKKS